MQIGKYLYILLESNSYVDKMSTNNGESFYHAKLGYINFLKSNIMIQKSLVNDLPNLTIFTSNEVYESCQFCKAHKLTF